MRQRRDNDHVINRRLRRSPLRVALHDMIIIIIIIIIVIMIIVIIIIIIIIILFPFPYGRYAIEKQKKSYIKNKQTYIQT